MTIKKSIQGNVSRALTKTVLAFAFTLLLTVTSLRAQQGTGNIVGLVKDTSGAVVSDATVKIVNLDRNETVELKSNDSGFYSSPPLVLGNNYKISVSHASFETLVMTGVAVTVGTRTEADASLKVGNVSTAVVVEASQASVLDTTSGTLGAVIGEKSIQELPLNGRNAIALTTLTPGVRVNTTVAQSGFANRGTNLSAISINGSPTGSNSYILDGQSNLSTTTGEIAVNPNVDSIQEFKVQSGVFSAQYGFTLGGVVNLVSRSGSNGLHGSVYEFVRNDIFNARNVFAKTGVVAKPILRYNQFGGAVGGAVFHDRGFFFGNYEMFRFIQAAPQYLSVPTAAFRAGDFSLLKDAAGNQIQLYNPYTTTIVGGVAKRIPYVNNQITNLDPVSVAYQAAFYPLPNTAPANAFTNTNNYLFNNRGVSNMYNALGRFDYHLGAADTAFVRYAYFSHSTNGGTAGGTYYPNPIVANRSDLYVVKELLAGDTHIFSSTLINDLRLSIERQEFSFQAASAGQNWPSKLGLPSNVPNFAIPTVANGLPASNQTIGFRAYTLPQVTDTVSKTIGRHAVNVGMDLRLNVGANLQRNAPSGTFNFAAGLTSDPSGAAPAVGFVNTGNTYATFLAGAVSGASIVTNTGQTDRSFSASFFVQDDWQVSDRLTMNLGLRYDFQQQPYEQNNGYSNFNPKIASGGFLGVTQYANVGGLGRNFVSESYKDFGPRAGFALKVTNDGKTVLRGGIGVYYPLFFNSIYVGQTNGFANTPTTYGPAGGDTRQVAFQFKNGFPTNPIQPLGSALGPLGFLGQAVGFQDRTRWHSPMSQQYTLSLERQIPYDIVLQAAYVGNHGVHLPAGGYNLNQLDPKYFSLGTTALAKTNVANPNAGQVPGSLGAATITRQQSLLPFPYYGSVNVYNPHDGNLIAHYFELSAQRQARKGLTVLFGYTFGKLMTDSAGSPLSFLNGIAGLNGYQNVYDRHSEYSVDPTDVSQRATVSALYDLPFGKGHRLATHNPFVDRVIGGFQFNIIGVFQTGFPLAITGANAFTATRPDFVPGATVAVDHPTRAQWFNTAAFQNPSDFTFGNVPRTLPRLRAPGTQNFDFSIFKTTAITDRFKLQLRAESFNVLNHPNYGTPNTAFTGGSNPIVNGTGVGGGKNTSGTFGLITTAAEGRSLQLAAKFLF